MNDPHVRALQYRLTHAQNVDFSNAPPIEYEQPTFSIQLQNRILTVAMKEHHATAQSARAVVEPFLRDWELSAALFSPIDKVVFSFQSADIVDRNPTPGQHRVVVDSGLAMEVSLSKSVIRSKYPDPPIGLRRNSDVDLMFNCYQSCHETRRTLADASYFCLTILERAAGSRHAAAHRFRIASKVLSEIGRLTASKGGKDARKVDGITDDFTPQERAWLQAALKILVQRAAEFAYDATVRAPEITMADLPPI